MKLARDVYTSCLGSTHDLAWDMIGTSHAHMDDSTQHNFHG